MWPLLTLAFGAFVAQTTEYLPIGLLPQIGAAFDVPKGLVGALVTGYAWIAAISAIPLTLATAHVGRRTLFLLLLAVITAANALAAVTPNYLALAACRVVVALTHGVFWSILAAFATRVAPDMPPARATAWVFSGISAAVVGGVPLATALGQWVGWRVAFVAFSVLGVIAIVGGLAFLPPTEVTVGSGDGRLPRRNPVLYGAVVVTALSLTSHFCAYTFVLPVLDSVVGVPAPILPVMLFVFGVAGIAGNALGGWMSNRSRNAVSLALGGILCAQIFMLLLGSRPAAGWFEMVVWGAAVSLLIVGLQGWVLEIAPERADAASALYVTMFNIGIGSGALIGGVALERAGVAAVLYVAVLCGVASLIVLALTVRLAGFHRKEA
ncbi:MFS transporter [Paraburkholderia xenovorans]|uniref:MFS transporter n=1 Tax=Paraburkholderia xenovorans TaxID=36873 RepID=UPI0038B8FCD7